jgi:hypothetical protein
MFGNDYKLMPRTYSIKSYKKRESTYLKKLFRFSFYAFVILAIVGVSVLSAFYLN